MPKKAKLDPVSVRCTQCFSRGWPCDDSSPCRDCVLRGKEDCCKRVMYKNAHCTFAHKGDGFVNVIPFARLKSHFAGPPSRTTAIACENNTAGGGIDVGTAKSK